MGENTAILSIQGENIKWYKSLLDSIPIQAPVPNSSITGQESYFVTQTKNWLESEKAEVKVTIRELPVLTHNTRTDTRPWSQSATFTVCEGENVFTGAWPAISTGWSWTGPNGFSSKNRNPQIANISASQVGVYTATYTDANGCSNSLDLSLEVNTPEAITFNYQIDGGTWAKGTTATLCNGSDIQFAAWPVSGSSWSWTGPNGFTSNIRNPLLSNITSDAIGTYATTHTDINGCSASASFDLEACVVTGEEAFATTEAGVSVYPNPSSGAVYIQNSGSVNEEVKIYSSTGVKILNIDLAAGETKILQLKKGAYLTRTNQGINIICIY